MTMREGLFLGREKMTSNAVGGRGAGVCVSVCVWRQEDPSGLVHRMSGLSCGLGWARRWLRLGPAAQTTPTGRPPCLSPKVREAAEAPAGL